MSKIKLLVSKYKVLPQNHVEAPVKLEVTLLASVPEVRTMWSMPMIIVVSKTSLLNFILMQSNWELVLLM